MFIPGGKIVIVAGTATPPTPQLISANLPDQGGVGGRAQTIRLTALPGNAGIVYYGDSTMVVSTGVGIAGAIPKPVSATTGPFASVDIVMPTAANALDAQKVYIDGTTNDGVYVMVLQQ